MLKNGKMIRDNAKKVYKDCRRQYKNPERYDKEEVVDKILGTGHKYKELQKGLDIITKIDPSKIITVPKPKVSYECFLCKHKSSRRAALKLHMVTHIRANNRRTIESENEDSANETEEHQNDVPVEEMDENGASSGSSVEVLQEGAEHTASIDTNTVADSADHQCKVNNVQEPIADNSNYQKLMENKNDKNGVTATTSTQKSFQTTSNEYGFKTMKKRNMRVNSLPTTLRKVVDPDSGIEDDVSNSDSGEINRNSEDEDDKEQQVDPNDIIDLTQDE